jgi:hypothetical protein
MILVKYPIHVMRTVETEGRMFEMWCVACTERSGAHYFEAGTLP